MSPWRCVWVYALGLILLVAAVALSGCASNQPVPVEPTACDVRLASRVLSCETKIRNTYQGIFYRCSQPGGSVMTFESPSTGEVVHIQCKVLETI